MAILLGAAAILCAALNILWLLLKKETKWFRFASMALTALSLCAFYSMNVIEVETADWSALMDVIPAIAPALWFLTIASVVLNGLSLFGKSK